MTHSNLEYITIYGLKSASSTDYHPDAMRIDTRYSVRMDLQATYERIQLRIKELRAQGEDATERNVSMRACDSPDQIRKMKKVETKEGETKKGQTPGAGKLEAIARVLGVSYTWLTTGLGDKFEDVDSEAFSRAEMALAVEKSATDVLTVLEAGGIIKGMSIPVEQAATLVRGVWQRRNQNPRLTVHEIAPYLAEEVGLLTDRSPSEIKRLMDAFEQGDIDTDPTPPCKPN